MKKKYVINQANAQKVRAKMKEVTDVKSYNKLEIIALSEEGLADAATAEKKSSNMEFIRKMRKHYCELGIDNFLTDGRKGGNHTIFYPEAEREFWGQFTQKSQKGYRRGDRLLEKIKAISEETTSTFYKNNVGSTGKVRLMFQGN